MPRRESTSTHEYRTFGQYGAQTNPQPHWDGVPTRIKRALLRAGVLRPEDIAYRSLPEVVGIAGLGLKGRQMLERCLTSRGTPPSAWAS